MYIKKLHLQTESILKQCRTIGSVALFFVFCLPNLVLAQNAPEQVPLQKLVPTPFLFQFQPGSNFLVGSYLDNQANIDSLKRSVTVNRAAVKDSRGHYRIVSFVMPEKSGDSTAINDASLQGSIVRSWLIKQYGLKSRNSTFYIDRLSGFENRVEVTYNGFGVPSNSSQTINYTLHRNDKQKVAKAISRYDQIPFLDTQLATNKPLEPTHVEPTEEKPAECHDNDKPQPAVEPVIESTPILAEPVVELTPEPIVEVAPKVFVPQFAIKTNLLLLAGVQSDFEYYGVTPNLALEYYFARKWSVNIDGAWADFKTTDTDTKERYAFSSIGVEARHWFGKSNAFKGLYAGLYGAYSQFNTMDPDKREGLGHSGDLYGGGLSLGYVLPITPRLMLEIGLRGGYRYADYQTYFHHDLPAPSHFEWSEDLTKSGFAIQSVNFTIGYRFGKTK